MLINLSVVHTRSEWRIQNLNVSLYDFKAHVLYIALMKFSSIKVGYQPCMSFTAEIDRRESRRNACIIELNTLYLHEFCKIKTIFYKLENIYTFVCMFIFLIFDCNIPCQTVRIIVTRMNFTLSSEDCFPPALTLRAGPHGVASCKFLLFFPVWMVLAVSLSPAKHMSSCLGN